MCEANSTIKPVIMAGRPKTILKFFKK